MPKPGVQLRHYMKNAQFRRWNWARFLNLYRFIDALIKLSPPVFYLRGFFDGFVDVETNARRNALL